MLLILRGLLVSRFFLLTYPSLRIFSPQLLPEPPVTHTCDINGLDLICGSSKCRSCKVQSMYKATSPWFHTATMQEQSNALFEAVQKCSPSFQRQVETILKPLM